MKIDNFLCKFDCDRLPISIDSNFWQLTLSVLIEFQYRFLSIDYAWLCLGNNLEPLVIDNSSTLSMFLRSKYASLGHALSCWFVKSCKERTMSSFLTIEKCFTFKIYPSSNINLTQIQCASDCESPIFWSADVQNV